MSVLVRRKARRAPPQEARLNQESRQALGLYAWYPLLSRDYEDKSARRRLGLIPTKGTVQIQQAVAGIIPRPTWRQSAGFLPGLKTIDNNIVDLPSYEACTLAGWVYWEVGADGLVNVGINIGTDSGSNNHSIQFYKDSANRFRSFIRDTGATTQAFGPNPTLQDTWYHIAVVFEPGAMASYVNGIYQSRQSHTRAPDPFGRMFVGMNSSNADDWVGHLFDMRVYNRALNGAEIYRLFDPTTRYDLWYEPQPTFWLIPPGAPSSTLEVDNASHALADTGGFALTQAHVLSPSSGAHTLTSPEVAVTTQSTLEVGSASHALADSGGFVLDQVHYLQAAGANHALLSPNVALQVEGALDPADADHGLIDNGPLALIQAHILALDDASHAHIVTSPSLAAQSTLETQNASHAHDAEALVLSQINVVQAADGSHALTSATLALAQLHYLLSDDASHAHEVDHLTISERPPFFALPDQRIARVASQARFAEVSEKQRFFKVKPFR